MGTWDDGDCYPFLVLSLFSTSTQFDVVRKFLRNFVIVRNRGMREREGENERERERERGGKGMKRG